MHQSWMCVHPVVVGVDPLLGHEAHLAAGHRVDGLGGDARAVGAGLVDGHEPLVGEHRLDDLAGARAARHHQAVLLRLHQQAQRLEVGHHPLARHEAVEAAVGGGRVVVDRGVEIQHADHRQAMALAHGIVVGIVRRRHLDDAGAEFAVDVGVGDDRDQAVAQAAAAPACRRTRCSARRRGAPSPRCRRASSRAAWWPPPGCRCRPRAGSGCATGSRLPLRSRPRGRTPPTSAPGPSSPGACRGRSGLRRTGARRSR